jgi:hypothetical protein
LIVQQVMKDSSVFNIRVIAPRSHRLFYLDHTMLSSNISKIA